MYLLQTENQPRRQTSRQAATQWFDSGDSEVPAPAAGQRKSAMHCPGHRSDFKVSPVTSENALPITLRKKHDSIQLFIQCSMDLIEYRIAERHPGHTHRTGFNQSYLNISLMQREKYVERDIHINFFSLYLHSAFRVSHWPFPIQTAVWEHLNKEMWAAQRNYITEEYMTSARCRLCFMHALHTNI